MAIFNGTMSHELAQTSRRTCDLRCLGVFADEPCYRENHMCDCELRRVAALRSAAQRASRLNIHIQSYFQSAFSAAENTLNVTRYSLIPQ